MLSSSGVLWPVCCGRRAVAGVLWPVCCGRRAVAGVLWPGAVAGCCGRVLWPGDGKDNGTGHKPDYGGATAVLPAVGA